MSIVWKQSQYGESYYAKLSPILPIVITRKIGRKDGPLLGFEVNVFGKLFDSEFTTLDDAKIFAINRARAHIQHALDAIQTENSQ